MDSRKIAFKKASKYIMIAIVAFFLYILQDTPNFLSIGGIKPIFLIA